MLPECRKPCTLIMGKLIRFVSRPWLLPLAEMQDKTKEARRHNSLVPRSGSSSGPGMTLSRSCGEAFLQGCEM